MQSSVAPMMDWTDNHYRTLARLISKHAWLYTEMVVADTIIHQQDNLVRIILERCLRWNFMILLWPWISSIVQISLGFEALIVFYHEYAVAEKFCHFSFVRMPG